MERPESAVQSTPALPFFRAPIGPIFGPWRRNPTLPKKPGKTPKSKAPTPRRRGPTCSRSGRRWRNCSIPRSTAAMPAWARAPACSRRRTIPGIAAPAAKPPRIARGRRRAKTSPPRSADRAIRTAAPESAADSGARKRSEEAASRKPRKPITARQRPSPRSIPNCAAIRLADRRGRRRRAGAAAAQQDGGARRRGHRGCAGRS